MVVTIHRIEKAQRTGLGFSLVELMVAVAIAAIIFASIYSAVAFGFDLVRITRENLRATQILEQKTETIRLYNWTQVTNSANIPTNFVELFYPLSNSASGLTYTGTLSVTSSGLTESYSNDLRLVTINLSWLSGKVPRTRTAQTYTSRYGLQNYVY
jgi:uncharacterized protein (TIGR02598 family)